MNQDTKSAASVPEEKQTGSEPSGPRAFPVVGVDGVWDPGMTLRAYIAAKVLPAVIDVNRENMKIGFEGEAEQAVRYADALIGALKAVQP